MIRAITATMLLSSLVASAPRYHVVDRWQVGGQGRWDYILSDDAAHRLYIAHNARVDVIDTTTGKQLGAVTGLKSTHGIALRPDGKTGYISDGAGNAIVVFDRATLAIIATVPAGTNPDGIVFEPTTNTLWAFNGKSTDVSVMDTATNSVVATIPLPGKPEFPQADGEGFVYDNIETANAIVKLDAKTHKLVATWPLPGCIAPTGMAIDRSGHRLFSVCDNGKMAIVDYRSGTVVHLAEIGDGPDAAGFDPQRNLAFSSNGDSGTLTVVDASQPGYPTFQTVPTEPGARTMTLDEATGRIYLVTATLGKPAPDAVTGKPHATIEPDTFHVLGLAP